MYADTWEWPLPAAGKTAPLTCANVTTGWSSVASRPAGCGACAGRAPGWGRRSGRCTPGKTPRGRPDRRRSPPAPGCGARTWPARCTRHRSAGGRSSRRVRGSPDGSGATPGLTRPPTPRSRALPAAAAVVPAFPVRLVVVQAGDVVWAAVRAGRADPAAGGQLGGVVAAHDGHVRTRAALLRVADLASACRAGTGHR